MVESSDRAALERLREALSRRGVESRVEDVTRWGGAENDPLREWKAPSLRLDRHLVGVPDRVVTLSWAPIYMWGRTTWPVDDPDGFAEKIASRYAEREACEL